MAKKERADQLLVQAGLAESREQAKRLIMAGLIYLDRSAGEDDAALPALPQLPPLQVDKPGHAYPLDSVFIRKDTERFVSRGAYKLLTALNGFALDVTGFVCLDAGASTGGFTDCLLQHGAAKVYAVDVGHAQLHEKLRNDPRVINMERTNLRTAPADCIPEAVDMIVADVSFISLRLVLPACLRFLKENGTVVALIKPQFELGPGSTDKGVVRDPSLRQQAVDSIVAFCRDELNLELVGVLPAAIKGPKGNQEFLACFKRVGL